MSTGGFSFRVCRIFALLCVGAGLLALSGSVAFAQEEASLTKAETAFAAHDYERALALYGELLRKDSGDVSALLGQSQVYGARREFDKAIAGCDAVLRSDPSEKRALHQRFFWYEQTEQWDKAKADSEKLLALAPNDPRFEIDRARLEARLKASDAALAHAQRALELKANRADVLDVQAEVLKVEGAYAEALDICDELHRLDPASLQHLFNRAGLSNACGRQAEGLRDLEEIERRMPDDSAVQNGIAWLLATSTDTRLHDGPRAVALAKKVCERLEWKGFAEIDTLAAAYARAGDFEKAVEFQKRAVALCNVPEELEEMKSRIALYERKEAFVEGPKEPAKVEWSLKRSECFQTVWQTVNDNYFDPTFAGADWMAIREKYRLQLWKAADNQALRRMLQTMLDELHRTHFEIVPREMSVLNPEERGRIGYTGAEVSLIDGGVTILRVNPDSPAAQAGIRCGDIVRAVGGQNLDEIEKKISESVTSERKRQFFLRGLVNFWLTAPVGTEVKLKLKTSDGNEREVTLKAAPFDGVWSEAMGFTPSSPMEMQTERTEDGVVYYRFSQFALPAMTEFKRCVHSLRPNDGLILDLRGNPGGLTLMAPGMFGRLCASQTSLGTMRRRDGSEDFVAYPQRGAFLGPVAILVDGASASTSEILAAAMQETGRGRVFGENTAGAALPSLFRKLPTGDMLQYAVGDITTPKGRLIEGNGVLPDETVSLHRADCIAGVDPVRLAAERWIRSQKTARVEEAK